MNALDIKYKTDYITLHDVGPVPKRILKKSLQRFLINHCFLKSFVGVNGCLIGCAAWEMGVIGCTIGSCSEPTLSRLNRLINTARRTTV